MRHLATTTSVLLALWLWLGLPAGSPALGQGRIGAKLAELNRTRATHRHIMKAARSPGLRARLASNKAIPLVTTVQTTGHVLLGWVEDTRRTLSIGTGGLEQGRQRRGYFLCFPTADDAARRVGPLRLWRFLRRHAPDLTSSDVDRALRAGFSNARSRKGSALGPTLGL